MREPRAQMVAGTIEENLRLVFEPAEGARVDDTVAVALLMCAPFGRSFFVFAAAGVTAELCVRREDLALNLFQLQSGARHGLKRKGKINSPAIPARKSRATRTAGGWCLQSNCSGRTRRRSAPGRARCPSPRAAGRGPSARPG